MNRKVELVANIVIVVSGLFLGIRFFFPNVLSSGHRAIPSTINVGAKFDLKPADSGTHDLTLVMALREGCHFCAESGPFYQRLTGLTKDSQRVHLMAVLPQQVAEGKDYLAKMGVAISDVQQGGLEALNVGYTPTLLLLDRSGVVRKVWVGKLSAQREAEVLKELGL